MFPDRTFDWIAKDVYPKLVGAMGDGLKAARTALGDTNVILFDHTNTMVGHRLCEKGTKGFTNYPDQHGRNLPWQDNNGIQTEWINEIDRRLLAQIALRQQVPEVLPPAPELLGTARTGRLHGRGGRHGLRDRR